MQTARAGVGRAEERIIAETAIFLALVAAIGKL
jgi:hypothetical protein